MSFCGGFLPITFSTFRLITVLALWSMSIILVLSLSLTKSVTANCFPAPETETPSFSFFLLPTETLLFRLDSVSSTLDLGAVKDLFRRAFWSESSLSTSRVLAANNFLDFLWISGVSDKPLRLLCGDLPLLRLGTEVAELMTSGLSYPVFKSSSRSASSSASGSLSKFFFWSRQFFNFIQVLLFFL